MSNCKWLKCALYDCNVVKPQSTSPALEFAGHKKHARTSSLSSVYAFVSLSRIDMCWMCGSAGKHPLHSSVNELQGHNRVTFFVMFSVSDSCTSGCHPSLNYVCAATNAPHSAHFMHVQGITCQGLVCACSVESAALRTRPALAADLQPRWTWQSWGSSSLTHAEHPSALASKAARPKLAHGHQ